MSKTQLIQKRIDAPMSAIREFASTDPNQVPLVLIPDDRLPCSCLLQVPSGVNSIKHVWGDDVEEKELAPPGLQCLPPYHRIAYCVTQSSTTYNAPVKSCPTSDNVMVDCDLTLVFAIGPDPVAVKNFVYNLGASRFNEFLSAATEEGIRQLVRQTPHDKVYELRGGALVQDMLQDLNEKFSKFGVMFTKAAITDVQLGEDLARTLEATTAFESKIAEQTKHHEHNIKLINFEADQRMQELQKTNERRLQDLHAAKERAITYRDEQEIEAQSRREVAVTKAEENVSIAEIRAQSNLKVAANQGRKGVEAVIANAQSNAQSKIIEIEKECEIRKYESEKKLEAAKDLAEALKIEAEAEGKAAESLKAVREHNLAMAKAEVLEAISRNNKIVVSGDNGDRLIASLLEQACALK